jgi:hypothetical protein
MPSIARITAVVAALSAGALALLLAPSPARAGDPCPIRFAAVDLGVPSWGTSTIVLRLEGSLPPADRYELGWYQQPLVSPDTVSHHLEVSATSAFVDPAAGAPSDPLQSRTDGLVSTPFRRRS